MKTTASISQFWKEYLAGITPCLFPSLTTEKKESQKSVPIEFAGDSEIQQFCLQQGITHSDLFQLTWAIVIASYTSSDCILFGYRDDLSSKDDNVVEDSVYRLEFDPARVVSDLLTNRDQSLQNSTFRAGSTSDILDMAGYAGARLFNTFVHLQRMANEIITSLDEDYELVVKISIADNGCISGSLGYSGTILADEQALHVASTFSHVVAIILANPGTCADEMNLFTMHDHKRVCEWNNADLTHSKHCIHHLIAERCREQPQAVAIAAWDGEVTYQALDEMSSRLAHHLFQQGVGPGDIIPVCFEKSRWAVIAVLGVIKTGAAYVLIDPTHPLRRLQDISNDVNAKLVLSSVVQVSKACSLAQTVVTVSENEFFWSHETSPGWIHPSSQPIDPAYITYTSGSTGKPKGAIIEHAAFSTKAIAAGPALALDRKPRVLQFASFGFDVSNRDILTTLIWGGCLCMPSEKDRQNNLSKFILDYRVTWASLTPSIISLLVPEKVPTLEYLVSAGEPMSIAMLNTWATRVRLMNAYGVSECPGVSVLQPRMHPSMDCLNVGHGLAARIWLVDPKNHNRLAPVGTIGEIVIESWAMARGYLNDMEGTEASFLKSATWQDCFPGHTWPHRLYKTGDLARYNALDGSITTCGRRDGQVKLNGQRVELSDVESHVFECLKNTATKDAPDFAVEVMKVHGAKAPRLAACIVVDGTPGDSCIAPLSAAKPEWQDLPAQLAHTLPRFMIPSLFIPLWQMPTTLTGKKDRKTLRQLLCNLTVDEIEACAGAAAENVEPLTEVEYHLQSLWGAVLGWNSEKIGRRDDFFRLGGDSIAAVKLVGMARELDVHFQVADVFTFPVLADLANLAVQGHQDTLSTEEYRPFSLLGSSEAKEEDLDTAQRRCQVSRDRLEDVYPCTSLQEGMFSQTLKGSEGAPTSYVSRPVFDLPSDVDLALFRAAWEETVQKTPILRTRIFPGYNRILQAVIQTSALSWMEWRGTLEAYIQKDSEQAMQFGDSLVRFALVYQDTKVYFVLTIHHSLFDGWSLPIVLEMVEAAYNITRPPRTYAFSSFIAYIEQLQPVEMERYWRAELAGCTAPSFPALPSLNYIPRPQSRLHRSIDIAHSSGTGATIATAIRLAWSIVQSQYTGSDETVFNVVDSGRNVPVVAVEEIVGPTITTVPMRSCLEMSRSVEDVLLSFQQQTAEMIPHTHFGLQRISRLSPECKKACQSQMLLVIHPASRSSACLLKEVDFGQEGSKTTFGTHAITILCSLGHNNGVDIEAIYDEVVVSASQMGWILDQFTYLLLTIQSQPKARLMDAVRLSPEHMAQIQGWNQQLPEAVDSCLHTLISSYAANNGNAVAVSAWDGEVTYGELDHMSSKLARELSVRHGIGPEDFVPLCFNKSKYVVISLVAILKAGGAFLLLEPLQPVQRLQSLCQDVNAKVVLASMQYTGLMRELGLTTLMVNDSELDSLQDIEWYTETEVGPANSAYIVFTSGSTGKPKGAVVEHAAIATNAVHFGRSQLYDSQSRMLQFASYTFDCAVSQTFYPLVNGGCVCIPEEAERHRIAQATRRYQINMLYLTPSLARTLNPEDFRDLKVLILGGEAVQALDIAMWADRTQFVNTYGPAECAVDCTTNFEVKPLSEPNNIGSGVACSCWVVDPDNLEQLMPLGSIGELLVEGPNVGRGYLNDHDKTAAAFTEPPSWLRSFRPKLPHHVYRTGDLVQYSSLGDGTLRFLGRKDNQVKLRGQRIELGEIESHLQRYFPAGKAVLAETITPTGGQPTLTALIESTNDSMDCDNNDLLLPAADEQLTSLVEEAETKLCDVLPSYMVPTVFLPMRYLPLNPSGKTDRKTIRDRISALTQQDLRSYRTICTDKQPPVTQMETVLHGLISRVLDMPPIDVGMSDHFVHLGGDSISAMKLVGDAYKDGFTLTVADVFNHPQIADLATIMRNTSTGLESSQEIEPFTMILPEDNCRIVDQASKECGVEKNMVEDIYPCTPLQEGLLAITMAQPGAYVAHQNFRLSEQIDIPLWRAAWQATFQANPILRTHIIQTNQALYQVVLRESFTWITRTDNEQIPVDSEPGQIMGLGTSLIQLTLITQLNGQYKFIVTMHHALYDGWSLPQLLRQAQEAYRGEQLSLRPFTPFVSYLVRQDRKSLEEYWRSSLRGVNADPFPSLPSKKGIIPNPQSILEHTIPTINLPVTKATAIKLAWAIVLSQYTGSENVVFGVTTSGRDIPVHGIEQITGPTITTYPLHVSLKQRGRTMLELMRSVQQQALELIGFQHFGLQNISRLSTDAEAACQFQNLLVIQPQCDSMLSGTEGVLTPIHDRGGHSGFGTYPLTLICDLLQDSVQAYMSFDSDFVTPEKAQRLLSQFSHALAELQRRPDSMTTDFDLLNPQDVSQLSEWTKAVPETVDDLVHRKINSVCQQQPYYPAVCAWDGDFTYHQLDELASQLAAHLQSLGAGPETFIPICLEKTRWVVVAMLGILKAGSAFVLMDPSHPVRRLQAMCEDVDAKIVISALPNIHASQQLAPHIIDVTDEEASWRKQMPSVSLLPLVRPTNALYCAFTSGSTGKPKGVVIEHSSFCSLAVTYLDAFGLNTQSRVLQFVSYAFDPSITDTLCTLLAGGCICIPSENDRTNDLPGVATRMRVNWTTITPSVLQAMSPKDFPTLETVVVGGESMSGQEVRVWSEKVNLKAAYGPAECTVATTIQSSVTNDSDLFNIGHTLAGDSWIVNPSDHNQIFPLGAVGELIVGGPRVGRGYINNPAANAKAFVTVPPPWLGRFRNIPDNNSVRLYKTGDLVQYTEDGSLRFVGRKDTQVKIRGQRVEISDIEQNIQQCLGPANRVAVELVPASGNSDGILTAFIEVEQAVHLNTDKSIFAVPSENLQAKLGVLQKQLQERLPVYMNPSRFLVLHHMPLSLSGKADRQQLRDHASAISVEDLGRFTVAKEHRLPATPQEDIILQLCAGALELNPESIGMEDSFFHLGGDSIRAMKLVSQARRHAVRLQVTDIIQNPRLSDLAAAANITAKNLASAGTAN